MLKIHKEHSVLIELDGVMVNVWYFYTPEKRDVNGNSRFRVFISDPDANVIYERIFKCYESQIESSVKNYIENYLKEDAKKC